jgi:hypothetical protein
VVSAVKAVAGAVVTEHAIPISSSNANDCTIGECINSIVNNKQWNPLLELQVGGAAQAAASALEDVQEHPLYILHPLHVAKSFRLL